MNNAIIFEPRSINGKFATGFALLLGCFLAWISGLITEAMGILVLSIAGFLGLYAILDALYVASRKVIVTDQGLTISNPLRLWGTRQDFGWDEVKQLELSVRDEQRSMRIKADKLPNYYYEDVPYDPELLQAVVTRGKLKPVKGAEAPTLTALPNEGKAVYRWAKK
ncbi:hypothetical protein [Candidatus Amarolinea dominans]|uniref:hypothetical protein n=1 Tax=Candidatus Amarolinea dominans TaxID=3140696 RepID=UPI0031371EF7|nr:hypothetical protein [Anaerolineae bacterium]